MPGPSVYPNAIDGYAQLPFAVDGVTPVNAHSINILRSAILNIEQELGINPSGSFEDVSTRVEQLERTVSEITGNEQLIGDSITVNFLPTNYTRDSSAEDTDELDQLGSHLLGIDNEIAGISLIINGIALSLQSHSSQHVNGGSDVIDGDLINISFSPLNYVTDNSIPEAISTDDLSAHLKGIDNYLGTTSSVTVPGVVTENAITVWGDGSPTFNNSTVMLDSYGNLTDINTAEIGNQKFWGALSSNPSSGSSGDMYYNTVIGMMMCYDSARSKWLSIESATFSFGRNGATQAGQYFRGVDGRILSSSIGFYALRNGTIVSITYTKSDSNSATIEVTSNGSQIATLSANLTAGRDLSTNADFSFGNVIGVRNLAAGADTEDVQGWLRIKWRV